jgi:hypothetical protein
MKYQNLLKNILQLFTNTIFVVTKTTLLRNA